MPPWARSTTSWGSRWAAASSGRATASPCPSRTRRRRATATAALAAVVAEVTAVVAEVTAVVAEVTAAAEAAATAEAGAATAAPWGSPGAGLARAQLAADLGGHSGAVGLTRQPGGQHLHDLSHALHADRAGLGDRVTDQCGQFLVTELSGQVGSENVPLGPFGGCLFVPARRAERLGGLAALLGLAGEHLHDLLVAEITSRGARHLLVGDRGQCHPQGAHPHLITRPHGGVQIRAQPVLEFSHRPILGTSPAAVRACD